MARKFRITLFQIAWASAGLLAVGNAASPSAAATGSKSSKALAAGVADARIFLAHQSVGQNILDGVRRVAPALPIAPAGVRPPLPGIVHIAVGRNEDPVSKLAHFAAVMGQIGAHVDVAILKLCYADISATTDVALLERQYAQTFSSLAAAQRHTRFLHVTVPLTVVQAGPAAAVKRLLGRAVWGAEENRRRHEFNEWLRRHYGEALFDLARLESQTPSGDSVTFPHEGRRYPMLYAGYSDDGGHLSPQASDRVAAALLARIERLIGVER